MKPFLKWAGGKNQLLKEIDKYKPKQFNTFYEPFVGAGSVFMHLKNEKTRINDLNSELINTYKVVKDHLPYLLEELRIHENKNSREYFYELREWDRNGLISDKSDVERAARFIYLNKTCYNGLFRVNSMGQFNVPYGRQKNPNITNSEVLNLVSGFLNKNNVLITNKDFSDSVSDAKKGDFIYLDPPYAPLTNNSQNFLGYTLSGFSNEEQQRVFNTFLELDKKGCYVMLSNSDAAVIRELYQDFKKSTYVVEAKRLINSRSSNRGKINELIILNYTPEFK
ncbi:DNA adenine methylase [Enterococcus italicus]|uniref:DNA adenine methylase n=1 Tax=Enterococcus italicus TaxID=246144 RepID=UPI0028AE2D51|nr:DNA adenine methylase [Enterococcus italicus]